MTSTETSSFDPKDPMYQVDPAFPPDKEETWSYPKEKDGWMLEHNSIRGEVTDMKEALAAVAKRGDKPPAWVIDNIQKWWAIHNTHIHEHHSHEDDLFSPFFRTRVKISEKVEADHQDLIKILNEIDSLVKNIKAEDEMEKVEELIKKWDDYESMLFPHLLEEEATALPLSRAYFTQKEVAPIIQKVVGMSAPETMGAFIHYNGGEDYFRNVFMKQEGIPSFVWPMDMKKKYNLYVSTQLVRIEALKTGQDIPVTAQGGCACIIL